VQIFGARHVFQGKREFAYNLFMAKHIFTVIH